MRKGWLALGSVVLLSVAVGHWGCEVPPLMAPGSSLTVFANPTFIVANGGVSVITALVVEPAGTLVPDGTVVFFFTNLGRVDPEGKTVNGVARVNLISDARSGPANVTAFSGGAAPAPSGSAASGSGSSVTVNIGSALPDHVIVTADPQRLRGPGSATIIANVFDDQRKPGGQRARHLQHHRRQRVAPPSPARLPRPSRRRWTAAAASASPTRTVRPSTRCARVRPQESRTSSSTVTATTANSKTEDVQVAIN